MSNSKKIVIRLVKKVDYHLPYYRLYAGDILVDHSYLTDFLILHAFALFVSDERYILDDKLDEIFGVVFKTLTQKRRDVYGSNAFTL